MVFSCFSERMNGVGHVGPTSVGSFYHDRESRARQAEMPWWRRSKATRLMPSFPCYTGVSEYGKDRHGGLLRQTFMAIWNKRVSPKRLPDRCFSKCYEWEVSVVNALATVATECEQTRRGDIGQELLLEGSLWSGGSHTRLRLQAPLGRLGGGSKGVPQ